MNSFLIIVIFLLIILIISSKKTCVDILKIKTHKEKLEKLEKYDNYKDLFNKKTKTIYKNKNFKKILKYNKYTINRSLKEKAEKYLNNLIFNKLNKHNLEILSYENIIIKIDNLNNILFILDIFVIDNKELFQDRLLVEFLLTKKNIKINKLVSLNYKKYKNKKIKQDIHNINNNLITNKVNNKNTKLIGIESNSKNFVNLSNSKNENIDGKNKNVLFIPKRVNCIDEYGILKRNNEKEQILNVSFFVPQFMIKNDKHTDSLFDLSKGMPISVSRSLG